MLRDVKIVSSLQLHQDTSVDLAVKPALAGDQPILVFFNQGGHKSEPYALPVPVKTTEFQESAEGITTGDPLEPQAAGRVIVSGAEEQSVASWIRPIEVPNATCVLAEQQYGFEHLKRNHTVICANGTKARQVWFRQEGAGPTWSTIDVKNGAPNGTAKLIYYEGFMAPEGPESLTATALTWTGGNFRETPAPVHKVIAGSFSTAEAARKARDVGNAKSPNCGKYFWVLQGANAPFELAAETTRDAKTLPLWKDWQSCYPALIISGYG